MLHFNLSFRFMPNHGNSCLLRLLICPQRVSHGMIPKYMPIQKQAQLQMRFIAMVVAISVVVTMMLS